MREGWKNLAFLLIVAALSLGLGACASDDPAPMEMVMEPPPPPPPPRAPMADPSNAMQIASALSGNPYVIEPLLGEAEIRKNGNPLDDDSHDLMFDGGVARQDRGGYRDFGHADLAPSAANQFTMGDMPAAIPGFEGSTWGRVKTLDPDNPTDTTMQESDLVAIYTNKSDPQDADYLDFGYWLIEFYDEGEHHHFLHVFAKGTMESGNVVPVMGTATYEGGATGLYVLKEGGTPSKSGQFTASAMLLADFGDASGTGTISGTISDFKDETGEGFYPGWSVPLGISQIGDTGRASGPTTGGGAWKGQFYGPGANNDAPDSVAGTFDAHLFNGHVGGAFGAIKQ